MKIILLGSYGPSLINFRGELIGELCAQGFDVHAAAPEIEVETRQKLEQKGCTVHDVELQRTGLNPGTDLKTYRALKKLMLQIKPDIFLGYTIKPVIYGNLAAKAAGVPIRCGLITGLGSAFTAKTGFVQSLAMSLARRMYRSALRSANVVMFQNPDDRDLFLQMNLVTKEKCRIVNGSGVNTQYFAQSPLPEEPVFLLIARLLVDKGIREYIQAIRILKKQYPDAKCKLVGWIDPHPFAIEQPEVDEWVGEGLIEHIPRVDDVRPIMESCSVYVLPSYREGTPRTVLEAMSMGRPVVTSDAPGCRETVTDGVNGFLVKVKEAGELSQAMLRLAGDAKLRQEMAEASRRIAVEKYDVNKVNQQIIEYITS